MYKIPIVLLMFFCGVTSSAKILAQSDSIKYSDMAYIKNTEAWLTSYNAAGLYTLSVENISIAEVYLNKSNGKFRNYYQSDNSYIYGGRTESYFRLSPKVVLYGSVGYSNFEGKNMSGSAFINPYYNSFDIVEYADSTAGTKQMEQYHLVGAISAEVRNGLRLGGKIDYLAANYAKFKDLRHQNKLLDMSLAIGASYKINSFVELGVNYLYRRSTEDIKFKKYGNVEGLTHSLISFGAFYGRRESFGGSEYTKDDTSRPVFNEFHGGSAQLKFTFSPNLYFFNELTYKSRNGYYGSKASGEIQYTRNQSSIYQYNGTFSVKRNNHQHLFRLIADMENMENYEKVYKKETTQGGVSTIVYYGETKMLDKDIINAKLEYIGYIDVHNNYPTWVLNTSMGFFERKQTVSSYPYFRKQTIRTIEVNVAVDRNIFVKDKIYGLSLQALYRSGSGTDKKDGLYAPPSETQKPPESIDRYLYGEYEYLTASRMGFNLGFRYTQPVSQAIVGYAAINCELMKAMDIHHLKGNTFISTTIKIGCSF